MPRNVVRFERLIYVSLVIGLIAALADFSRVLELQPKNVQAHIRRAEA